MNEDLSVPTIVRNAAKFEQMPAHIQIRATNIAEKQMEAELLAKHLEDETAAIMARRNELEVSKSELETLKSDLRTECRRHIMNNL